MPLILNGLSSVIQNYVKSMSAAKIFVLKILDDKVWGKLNLKGQFKPDPKVLNINKKYLIKIPFIKITAGSNFL